jgi:membrane protease YdiL (CAAX protease family)
MKEAEAQLSDSPFLATIDASDRSLWRMVATLVAGLGGGFLVAASCGLLVVLVVVLSSLPVSAIPAEAGTKISALIGANGGTLESALFILALAVCTNGPWAATFLGAAVLIGRRRVLDYITAAGRFRWRLLLAGLVFSILVLGPLVAATQLTDPHAQTPPVLALAHDVPSQLLYVAASIGLLIPAAAAEEVIFRGWLLRQSGAFTRNPFLLMAVNGVLFSAVHLDFAPDAFLMRALMGAGFVYMTLRLGGIEFSTGAHAANNIMIVIFIQPLALKSTAAPSADLDAVIQGLFLFLSYVVMAEVTARWTPLRRWSEADRAIASSAAAPAGPWSAF